MEYCDANDFDRCYFTMSYWVGASLGGRIRWVFIYQQERLETIRGNFGVDPVVFITITITIINSGVGGMYPAHY